MNLDWLHPSHPSCVFRSLRGPQHHGEQPSARCTVRPQVLCRMWGEDCRPLSALLHGALLAYALPQVLLLPSPAGGHRYHLLQQRGHDSLSERLHQVRARGRRERKLLIFRFPRPCRSYQNQIFVFVFADCLGTAGRAVPAASQFQPMKW